MGVMPASRPGRCENPSRCSGQPDQPVSDSGGLLARLGLVAEAGRADLEGLGGMPDPHIIAVE